MSKELLYYLNRGKEGRFKAFLDGFDGEPRIAWYPSAGEDFRSLMYLHPSINEVYPVVGPEPPSPDLFLFTDYYPWEYSTFLDNPIIYDDGRTMVEVEHIEELRKLRLPLHTEIVHFREGSKATNRVLFMLVRVTSNRLGEFVVPVVYAFAENAAFYCNVLAEQNASISHIIHIGYGGCCSGGNSTGAWLMNVMQKLNTEVYVSDRIYEWQDGDRFALEFCDKIPPDSNAVLTPYRTIERIGWEYNLVQYGGINEDI